MAEDSSAPASETTVNVDELGTADTMRERSNESAIKLWLLLGANRLAVTAVLALAVFAVFLLAGLALFPSFPRLVDQTDVVETLFSTMLSAIITGATLVVSINQLVISQELGPLGDQRARMSDALDFRTYASEVLGGTVPTDPSEFLSQLIEATKTEARQFRESISTHGDRELREQVDVLVENLTENADTVIAELDGATFGTFGVLQAALDYNYSSKLFHFERIQSEYGDSLDEEAQRELDELRTALSMYGPAREHIKTLYFQWTLVDLSQIILYAALPALVVAAIMVTFVDAGTFSGVTFGVPNVLLVVAAAFTVTTIPFLVFISYILRIAIVAKRTLAIGPLILRDSQR